MPEIFFTESYNKRATKFLKKHPEVIGQYSKVLKLMEINPHHPSLRLHKLKGRLSDVYSVAINMMYRITIDFIIKDDRIIPVDIGSHDDIYR